MVPCWRAPSLSAPHRIRPARHEELADLQDIEDLAGELYATAGLPPDLEGLPMAAMEAAQDNGLVWVTVDADDVPIAFALCWLRPDSLHLREIDVHPDYSRRGLGRQMIQHLVGEARRRGLKQITLTTFSEVPWNAPLYKRYGFVELATDDWPDWMQQIRADEEQIGLDRWPRIAMVKPVAEG